MTLEQIDVSETGTEIQCARCGRTAPAVASVPYGGALGEAIRTKTCTDCWKEWEKTEVIVINELRLDFMDPKSLDILTKHLREFLVLDSAD